MILVGDCRERLRELPAHSVQTCVTSPPYFGLRDYGTGGWKGGDDTCDHLPRRERQALAESSASTRGGGHAVPTGAPSGEAFRASCGKCGAARVDRQIGLEPTPDEFVAALVEVFREVRRVLRDDGTVWLNLGDSYASPNGSGPQGNSSAARPKNREKALREMRRPIIGAKPKDLLGVPWMVAFALRADGWYLRSDIIWAKPNPMPESVTDRPTKAHEYLFLLAKAPRYFYDADAIREPHEFGNGGRQRAALRGEAAQRFAAADGSAQQPNGTVANLDATEYNPAGRNKRSVWTVATQPYAGAHFATFPPKLIEPCILAGSPPKCCGECGAPWQRVVERTAMVVRASERSAEQGDEINDRRTATSGTMIEPPTSRTIGWEPTCECIPMRDDDNGYSLMLAEENAVPSKVLDPFAGAGTVGVVCGWHARDFVGVELNPEYAAMAEARIALEGRPGGKPSGHERPNVHDDQLGFEEVA